MTAPANDVPMLPAPSLPSTQAPIVGAATAPPPPITSSRPLTAPPTGSEFDMPVPHAPNVASLPATAPSMPLAPSGPPNGPTLDGDLPRLGVGHVAPPPAVPATEVPDFSHVVLPTLPTPFATPSVVDEPTVVDEPSRETGEAREPVHPMAHLMPPKSAPSEAKRRADELRAAKKAKAKKVKIGVAAGFLVLAVAVGPPLGRWFVNAINAAGSTSTEQPAG